MVSRRGVTRLRAKGRGRDVWDWKGVEVAYRPAVALRVLMKLFFLSSSVSIHDFKKF